MENLTQFERRKRDHIRIALEKASQTAHENRLDEIALVHEALPEIDLKDVRIESDFFGQETSPLFISSMTAGHSEGEPINLTLARAAAEKNWLMGVGSQRRQLFDPAARKEWSEIRKAVPDVKFIGNIGLSQLIESSTDQIKELIDSLAAVALFIHTNPVQECFQPEGTPNFRGGMKAIERICKEVSTPIILKETGSGFSQPTLQRLNGLGLHAVDVSGMGGTHWGRVEGARSERGGLFNQAAQTFADWGINTVDSLLSGTEIESDFELWASGGVRNGLDAAKLLAMGANRVGFAKVIMESAIQGLEQLLARMDLLEYELRVALFCTGCENIKEFQKRKVWVWKTQD